MMLQYEVICPTNLTQFSLTAAALSSERRAMHCRHLGAVFANCSGGVSDCERTHAASSAIHDNVTAQDTRLKSIRFASFIHVT